MIFLHDSNPTWIWKGHALFFASSSTLDVALEEILREGQLAWVSAFQSTVYLLQVQTDGLVSPGYLHVEMVKHFYLDPCFVRVLFADDDTLSLQKESFENILLLQSSFITQPVYLYVRKKDRDTWHMYYRNPAYGFMNETTVSEDAIELQRGFFQEAQKDLSFAMQTQDQSLLKHLLHRNYTRCKQFAENIFPDYMMWPSYQRLYIYVEDYLFFLPLSFLPSQPLVEYRVHHNDRRAKESHGGLIAYSKYLEGSYQECLRIFDQLSKRDQTALMDADSWQTPYRLDLVHFSGYGGLHSQGSHITTHAQSSLDITQVPSRHLVLNACKIGSRVQGVIETAIHMNSSEFVVACPYELPDNYAQYIYPLYKHYHPDSFRESFMLANVLSPSFYYLYQMFSSWHE